MYRVRGKNKGKKDDTILLLPRLVSVALYKMFEQVVYLRIYNNGNQVVGNSPRIPYRTGILFT